MKKQNVRTLSFIVSTFTYLLFGAAIFNALESQNEDNTRKNLTESEIKYKHDFSINDSDYSDLEEIVIKYHAYRTFPQWEFTGALYFSLTVITTIGYGHSTPQTKEGKIFCMIYAIIGIPLCLVMYQSLGERLNYFASFGIQFVKKCVKCRKKEVSQTEMVTATGVFALVVIAGGAAMFRYYENWDYFDSIYYCVITLTTIGFGDYVAMQNDLSNITYVVFTFTFILLGLTIVASTLNLLVLKFLTMNTDDERKEVEYNRKTTQEQPSNSDFLNVNGDLLCSFEPNDLDDLKTANSFKFCFPIDKKKRRQLQNILHRKHISFCTTTKNEQIDQTVISNLNNKSTCFSCSNNVTVNKLAKPSKSHYTIKRAPGKISHLLIPQRIDTILASSALSATSNDNHELFKQNHLSSQDGVIESFDKNSSDIYRLNRSTSLTFDVNLFIDEEDSQQDIYYNNSKKKDNSASTFKTQINEDLDNEVEFLKKSTVLVKNSDVDGLKSDYKIGNKFYYKHSN